MPSWHRNTAISNFQHDIHGFQLLFQFLFGFCNVAWVPLNQTNRLQHDKYTRFTIHPYPRISTFDACYSTHPCQKNLLCTRHPKIDTLYPTALMHSARHKHTHTHTPRQNQASPPPLSARGRLQEHAISPGAALSLDRLALLHKSQQSGFFSASHGRNWAPLPKRSIYSDSHWYYWWICNYAWNQLAKFRAKNTWHSFACRQRIYTLPNRTCSVRSTTAKKCSTYFTYI